jgi:glutathione S-transferase
MYRLYGSFTQNSMKPVYVLEELGVDFEYCFIDLMKGETRTDDFRRMTPAGKVPVLEHDGEFLFESGPICRYVASVEKSPLYPADKLQRARVDQWMTFFTCHPGRWLTKLYFERPMMHFPLLNPSRWLTWNRFEPLTSRWTTIHGSSPGLKDCKHAKARHGPGHGYSRIYRHSCRDELGGLHHPL